MTKHPCALSLILAAVSAASCSSSDAAFTQTDAGSDAPQETRLTPSTLDRTFATKPRQDVPVDNPGPGPSDPVIRDRMRAEGQGDLMEQPGEAYLSRPQPGLSVPQRSAQAKLLTRFVHLSDVQLMDDESPSRLASYDGPSDAVSSAARPHDAEVCALLNQAVVTINKIHANAPVDFVLLGGDNIDNAGSNELDWFLRIMDGSPGVKCDSGEPDDPVPGPANDGKDLFDAPGLVLPWYWTMGNHDILNQGLVNLDVNGDGIVDPSMLASYTGTNASGGTRVYTDNKGGAILKGTVIADGSRRPLLRKEVLQRIAAKTGGPGPSGHGVGVSQVASGKAHYSFDVGARLRFIVLDSAIETGSSGGMLRRADVDNVIKPMLDLAKADGRLVLLAAHHALEDFGNGDGAYGAEQADAVPQEELKALFTSYSNVIATIVGHTHDNRVQWIEGGGRGYWEIMTSSLVDWPGQFRAVEVFDQGGGDVSLRLTSVDVDVTGAPASVVRGRAFCAIDWVSGWGYGGNGQPADGRNVEVWIRP